jgi:hypothetical protein
MSREVRRVPADWQHPTVPNLYWAEQEVRRLRDGRPPSRLHGRGVRFRGLFDDYTGAVARHVDEVSQISRREGHEWTWPLGYYLRGWDDRGGQHHAPASFSLWAADGETCVEVAPEDEDHLQQLLIEQKASEAPDPAAYMPVFDLPVEQLGWCLYETVSEGTPVTPVFATAAELVEHLVQVGEDWDQVPYRREAAERLVESGSSLGSFLVNAGQVFDGARDLDRIEEAMTRDRT